MSVTLKLADEDARLVGNLLEKVAKLQLAVINNSETVHIVRLFQNDVSSVQAINRVSELSGAFKSAVRANER